MSLLNKKAVKEYALQVAKDTGRSQFARVSVDFVDSVEADLRNSIRSKIHRHPSVGVTLK